MKIVNAVLILILAVVFCLYTDLLPTIGEHDTAPNQHVTPYYIEHSYEDTGSPNIVTGVLADYRGFDTLGETSVMFVAGLTATLILTEGKKRLKKDEKGKGGEKR